MRWTIPEKELILMTVGNGTTFGGGFKLMPDATIDDGLLDVCEIGKLAPLKRFLITSRQLIFLSHF